MHALKLTCLVSLAFFAFYQKAHASTVAVDYSHESSLYIKLAAEQPNNAINYSGTMLVTNKNGNIVSGGIFSNGQMKSNQRIRGGLGARLYLIDSRADDFSNFQAIAFGGHVDIELPYDGFSIVSELYFAPSLTTFQQAESFMEFNVSAHWDTFENAGFYIGVRNTSVGLQDRKDHTFSDGLHIGFKIDI